MNDPREIQLLEEILRWIKIANYDAIKKSIEETLNDDKKKKAYMLTGKKTQTEITKAVKFSSVTLTEMWQECARKGILKKEGKSYKQLIDLEDYGLLPKDFDPEDFTENQKPKEDASELFNKEKKNGSGKEGSEND